MTSFISTLSLLVLVLATGCFTLPVIEEPFSSSTYSSLTDDLTTIKNNEMLSLTTPFAPMEETTESFKVHAERLLNDGLYLETSTRILSPEFEENASRAPRTFDELSTEEPFRFTTENSLFGVKHDERDYDDLLFTTAESVTEFTQHGLRSVTSESEIEDDSEKRKFQLELTTSYMPSFTSTSSAVAPQLYTSESSTSTEKYIGLLKDESDEEKESEQNIKTERKPKSKSKISTTTKKTKVPSEDKSQEDSKESNVAVAQLDQQALDKVSNVPSDVLILEETVEVVTVVPEKLSTTTIKDDKEHEYEHEHEHEDEHEHEHEHEDEHEPERERRPLPKLEREPKSKPEVEHDDEHERRLLPKLEREPKPELEHEREPKPELEHEREPKPELEHEREPEHEREDKAPKPLNQGKKPSLPEEKESDY